MLRKALALAVVASSAVFPYPTNCKGPNKTQRRLKRLQNKLNTTNCPPPKMSTKQSELFTEKELNGSFWCLDVKQAYDKRRQCITNKFFNLVLKQLKSPPKNVLIGFSGLCPEAIFLLSILPNAKFVCNELNYPRLEHGSSLHGYLLKNSKSDIDINYDTQSFSDLNAADIDPDNPTIDLLVLPSPKTNYKGVEDFDLHKKIKKLNANAILFWTQLPHEHQAFLRDFSTEKYRDEYDVYELKDDKCGTPVNVDPYMGVSFTVFSKAILLVKKDVSENVHQCDKNK